MEKEKWLQIRELEEIPMMVFFDFYKEKGGYIQDIRVFESWFKRICDQKSEIYTLEGDFKTVTFEGAKRKLFEHYNKLFDV